MLSLSRNTNVLGIALLLLTIAVYAHSLGNDFVNVDDGVLVYANPHVTELSPGSVAHVWRSYDPELYIPLTFLTYQLEHALFGLNPFVYHLTNLILHGLAVLLVFWLLRSFLQSSETAFLGAALFAVHPLHTETVVWVSARKDVLSGVFFLAAMAAYIQWLDVSQTKWQRLSILCFLLALLAKVTAITLPVVLLLTDWLRGERVSIQSIRTKWPYWCLAVAFGIIALLGKQAQLATVGFLEHILLLCKGITFLVGKFFLPASLRLLYHQDAPVTLADPAFAISLLVVLGLAAVAYRVRQRWPLITFGLGFAFITFLPSFGAVMKNGYVFFAADRYAYIPSLGLLVAVIAGGQWWLSTRQTSADKWRPIFMSGMLITCVICAILTYQRSLDWRDTESLHLSNVRAAPGSYAHLVTLGAYYLDAGEPEQAIPHLLHAQAAQPGRPRAYANLAAAYGKLERYEEGLQYALKAIELDPQAAALPDDIQQLIQQRSL